MVTNIFERVGIPLSEASQAESKDIEVVLKAHEVDVLIAQTGFVADRVAAAAKRAGIPYIVYFHGADLREGMKLKGAGRRIAQYCGSAAAVLVVGRYMVDQLVSLGVDPSKIHVEPMGAPVHSRQVSGPVGKDNTFLFIGRLVPCKAVDIIIDAVVEARSRGVHLTFNIAGDGPLKDKLERYVVKKEVDDRVHFLGICDPKEIEARIDEASSLVVHTVDDPGGPEAFGVSVTEAMASARPVIISRCGGLIDQIQDGKQGLVVEQRDVNGLANAMIRLGNDPQLRAKMGKAARERAEKKFDASDLARRVENLAVEIAESAHINSRKK